MAKSSHKFIIIARFTAKNTIYNINELTWNLVKNKILLRNLPEINKLFETFIPCVFFYSIMALFLDIIINLYWLFDRISSSCDVAKNRYDYENVDCDIEIMKMSGHYILYTINLVVYLCLL